MAEGNDRDVKGYVGVRQATRRGLALPAALVALLLGAGVAVAAPKTVEISNASAKVTNDPSEEGQKMMVVSFDATFKKKPGDKWFHLKSKCQVGEKSFVDTIVVMEALKDIDKDETKAIEAYAFATKSLKTSPSKCEFTLSLGEMFGTASKVHTFTWTP